MAEYKLYYFNSKGRAEVARYIFALADQQYEDIRFEKEDWPNHKANTPFGQLPVLEIKESGHTLKLAQSAAIFRYLGNKFGFIGKTIEENALVDSYADLMNDMLAGFIKAHYEVDPEKKKELFAKYFNEGIKEFLKHFEKAITENKSGFLVGDRVTWVDLSFSVLWEWIPQEPKQALFTEFQSCKAHYEKKVSLPKIAEWFEKRPVTEM
jgi:glutathione S-transferase